MQCYLLFSRESDGELEKYMYEGGIYIEGVRAEKPIYFLLFASEFKKQLKEIENI
jgi:hypothetical protein